MVAGEQQPHRGGEGEAAVAPVGGELLVTGVGSHLARQVFRVGEGVQTQAVVADAHLPCRKLDVLQGGVTFRHEREVAFYQPRLTLRPHNLVGNVRAALCWNVELGKLARQHNDANILTLPGRFIPNELAWEIVQAYLTTDFEGGRHLNRVQKINLK